jgi:hypothetical protein
MIPIRLHELGDEWNLFRIDRACPHSGNSPAGELFPNSQQILSITCTQIRA